MILEKRKCPLNRKISMKYCHPLQHSSKIIWHARLDILCRQFASNGYAESQEAPARPRLLESADNPSAGKDLGADQDRGAL